MLCTCIFHLLTFWRRSRSFYDVKWPVLQRSCVDDVSIWWQMSNFVFLCPKRWFQINSRTFRRHFSSIMTLNNWKMIAETRSYIFRWHSRFRRRRVCLSSLIRSGNENGNGNENATWKCTFWEWWLFCDHCFILTSFIVDRLRCKRTDRSAVNVNIGNERIAVSLKP